MMETIVRHEGRKILHSPQFAPRRRSLWHENATVEDSMARNGDCGGFQLAHVVRKEIVEDSPAAAWREIGTVEDFLAAAGSRTAFVRT